MCSVSAYVRLARLGGPGVLESGDTDSLHAVRAADINILQVEILPRWADR